jgi:hypothetical protein
MVKELERIFLVSQPGQLKGGMGKFLSLLSLHRHHFIRSNTKIQSLSWYSKRRLRLEVNSVAPEVEGTHGQDRA